MTIKILKAKKIKNPKGEILKFIDRKSSVYKGFGEVYFNNIRKNKKSNWIYHKKNQCIFFCAVYFLWCVHKSREFNA